MPADQLTLSALRALERNPDLTQRQLAHELGVSLGRTNYCVRALVNCGLVKVGNFRRSTNKRAYLYKLTPAGIAEKTRLAARFLRLKEQEYESLLARDRATSRESSSCPRCRSGPGGRTVKHWYAVHCKPRQDARAETHLLNQRFEEFRPKCVIKRRRGGRLAKVIESLFPR